MSDDPNNNNPELTNPDPQPEPQAADDLVGEEFADLPDLPYTADELAAMSPEEQFAVMAEHLREHFAGYDDDVEVLTEEELADLRLQQQAEAAVSAMAELYPDLTLEERADLPLGEVRDRVAEVLGIPARGPHRGDFLRGWDSGDPADRVDLLTAAANLAGVPKGLDLSAALFGETYPSAEEMHRVDAATGLASGRGLRSWQMAAREADLEQDRARRAAWEARAEAAPAEVEFPDQPDDLDEDRAERAERARLDELFATQGVARDPDEDDDGAGSSRSPYAHEDVSPALTQDDDDDEAPLNMAASMARAEWDPAAALSQEQLDARPPAELVVELLSSLEGAAEAAQDLLGRVGGVLRAEPGKLPAALRALRGWARAVVEASKTADDGLMSATDLFSAPAELPPLNSLASASAGRARPAPEPRAEVPPEVREALEARVREHNTRRLPPRWASRTGDAVDVIRLSGGAIPPAAAGPAAVAGVGNGVFPARAQVINPDMRAPLSGPSDARAPLSVRGELSLIAPAPAPADQAQAPADQAQAPADRAVPVRAQPFSENLARVLERHHRSRSGRDEDRARAEAARNRASARATEAVLDPAEIQSRRETLGLSVEELAERVGVHPDFVRDLEGGELHPRQRWQAVRVLHVLEVAGQPPHPSEGRSVSLSAVRATTVMSSAALRDAILGPPLSDLQEGGRNVVLTNNPARPPLSPPTASFRLEHDRVPDLAERFASGLPDDGAALLQEVEALVALPEPEPELDQPE